MRGRLRSPALIAGLVVAALTLVLPTFLNDAQLSIYIFIGLAAMVVAGLSLLMGFAGQVSLGQASFYAIGAYAAGILSRDGLPTLAGLAAAPVAAAAVAAMIGIPLLRLRGHYLAFATLAFQLIVLAAVGEAKSLTGGDIGLSGIPPLNIAGLELDTSTQYAYLTWVATAAVLLVASNVVHSRPGRALRAQATSEAAAAACGVPVGAYKLRVFALSAGFAGLAGGIYGFFLGFIAPASFPVLLSIQFLVMATVGGVGATWGSLVGATVITLLVQLLQFAGTRPGMPAYAPSVFSYGVYALVLVMVMLFLPQGLLPALRQAGERFMGRRKLVAPESLL